MEAPEAIGILLQVLHRIAAADEHVAHVELEPSDRRIETRDEDVERNLAVDRFLVIGLVVEREPDAGATRDRAGAGGPAGPLPPIVQRLLGPTVEIGDDQILVAQELRRLEAALPADEDRLRRHVARWRAQPFV